MNECTDSAIQEMLPDLLHRRLGADARARVEAHLATCEKCREDLEVLRMVNSAAVFAPTIDVDRVVRQIPPYQTIVPARELPARPRLVSWLVAAALTIVVLGGGSLLLTQYTVTPAPVAIVAPEPSEPIPAPPTSVASGATEPLTSPSSVVASAQPRVLTLAADVDGLSDGSLVQLMDEMNRFDALPDSESDPVISVDTSYDLGQDPR